MYYMDVCEDTKGQRFLSISEIPTDNNPGKKKRQRIFIHANNIEAFAEVFNDVLKWMLNSKEYISQMHARCERDREFVKKLYGRKD